MIVEDQRALGVSEQKVLRRWRRIMVKACGQRKGGLGKFHTNTLQYYLFQFQSK